MADSYKDILITPNRSNTADPKIEFRGGNSSVNTSISLFTYPTSNGTLSFEGSAGQLFSITNDLSGSIFSVNDISGIPSIEVFANGNVSLAQYNGNVGIGTSVPASKLDVSGGSLRVNEDGVGTKVITIRSDWAGVDPAINVTTNNNLLLMTNNTERMRISPAGTVGIGLTPYDTNSATYKLQLYAEASQCFMSFGNSTTGAGNDQGLTVGCDSTGADIYQRENAPLRLHTYDIERMRIAANGNVGIGTTSPAERLHIAGGNIQLENALELRSKDTGGSVRTITRVNSSDELEYGWSGNGPVKFMGGGSYTERIRIHTDGNVGIGTTSPAAALDVNGKAIFRVTDGSNVTGGFTITNDGAAESVAVYGFNSNPVFLVTSGAVASPHIAMNQSSADGNGSVLRGYKSRGTPTGVGNIVNGDSIFTIDAWAMHTTGPNYYKFGGGMTWYKDDGGGTASTYAPMSLKWVMANSTTTTIDAMTLLYNGNLTIAGTLTESSSIALKENINPISNALDLIASLTGVTYNRKDGSAINRAGLIAEEVDKVLPNVVQKDKEGNPSGIQYTNLIAYLVESIKELKAEIDILKGR